MYSYVCLQNFCLLIMKLINDSMYWHGTGRISYCLNRLLHEVLSCAPPDIQYIIEWLDDHQHVMNLKGSVKNCLWPSIRFYTGTLSLKKSKIASLWAKIWTQGLPFMKQDCWHLSVIFSVFICQTLSNCRWFHGRVCHSENSQCRYSI